MNCLGLLSRRLPSTDCYNQRRRECFLTPRPTLFLRNMHVVARQQLPPPPSSITPEYLNLNRGPFFLAIVATLVSIALLIFLLRVYTRIKLLRFFGIDDWLMLVAVVSMEEIAQYQGMKLIRNV